VLTSRSADAGGSVTHVLQVGWLVFWQEAERGNVRFSFFSPKSDLLGLNKRTRKEERNGEKGEHPKGGWTTEQIPLLFSEMSSRVMTRQKGI
jgi:hypothetical protein